MHLTVISQDLIATSEIQSSDFLRDLCTFVVGSYPDSTPALPWAGYLVEEQGNIVGTCAFKTAPVANEVEIAYYTFPSHEGQGVATRMAQRLVDLAMENGVTRVKAQTLPVENASVRILKKLGFTFAGTVQHPEDGEVWEWHKDA